MSSVDFAMRVIAIIADSEYFDGEIIWRANPAGGFDFYVQANDLFHWAAGDGERLTPDNIDALETAIADCRAADPVIGECDATLLFACRARGRRPQGAYYKHLVPALWPLFDACGPSRDPQFGNPLPRPDDLTSTSNQDPAP